MAQAICAMLFWELYLEDDCTNYSGNKVMDVQHNNLVTEKITWYDLSEISRILQIQNIKDN